MTFAFFSCAALSHCEVYSLFERKQGRLAELEGSATPFALQPATSWRSNLSFDLCCGSVCAFIITERKKEPLPSRDKKKSPLDLLEISSESEYLNKKPTWRFFDEWHNLRCLVRTCPVFILANLSGGHRMEVCTMHFVALSKPDLDGTGSVTSYPGLSSLI